MLDISRCRRSANAIALNAAKKYEINILMFFGKLSVIRTEIGNAMIWAKALPAHEILVKNSDLVN